MSEATPMKSHQHNCLNISWTRTTAINMSEWTGEIPRALNPTQRTKEAESDKSVFPEIAYSLVI